MLPLTSNSFMAMLTAAMDEYGVGCKKLEEILIDQGVTNISFKRISEYTNGVTTPSFEKAKILFTTLEMDLSDEDISKSLEINRDLIKEEKKLLSAGRKELRRNVRLKLKNLIPGQTVEFTELFLEKRIKELYGEGQFVNYIEGLVAKDLREALLNEEENQND